MRHFASSGPVGTLDSSMIGDNPREQREGQADEAQAHPERERDCESPAPDVVGRVAPTQGLKEAPEAVIEVKTEEKIREDVDRRHRYDLKSPDYVPVGIRGHEGGMGASKRQVHQVVDDVHREEV